MSGLWPFAQWGLDIVGPFPKTAGNKRYLLVGTDYFTKWVEAEPLANIKDADAKKLFGRILLLSLESLTHSSRIIDCNLIVKPSRGIAVIWT